MRNPMRTLISFMLMAAFVATWLSGCTAVPPKAAEAANKAVAGASNVAGKAAAGASGAIEKAAAGASGAAEAAGKVAVGASATAAKAACEGLQALSSALGQVGTLSPDTAVSDVVAFKHKVDPFVSPMRVLAVTMGMDPISQVILAYDAFGLLLNSLPADANLGAASNAMTASVAVLMGATAGAADALHCAP